MQAHLHLHPLQLRLRLPLQQVSTGGEVLDRQILQNADAARRVEQAEVVALTQRATGATFYIDGLTPEQLEANGRIPQLSGPAFFNAARSAHQHLAAAFAGRRLIGFVIATRHAPGDLELDWLMVDPDDHGRGTAALLMEEGMNWLGPDRPIWLTVIRHNHRAIRFYRRFGFEIDRDEKLIRPVPSWVMRRQGSLENLAAHS